MFGATSVLEGQIAVDRGTTPARLSEQQLVDCTLNTTANVTLFGKSYGNYGCGGGWEDRNYTFMIE